MRKLEDAGDYGGVQVREKTTGDESGLASNIILKPLVFVICELPVTCNLVTQSCKIHVNMT